MNEPLLREKHRVPQHFQPLCDARRALLLRNLLQLRGIRRDLLTAHEVLSAKLSQLAAAQPRPAAELDQLVVVRLRKVFVAHAVAAAALDVLPIPLGRLEIVLVVRLDPVKLADRLRLQLHRPRGKLLIRSALKPFVDILFRAFERRTLRMLLLDIAKEIFDVLPIAFICIYREDLILFHAFGHGFLFALAEGQHLGQPIIGLLVQILVIGFVLPPHPAPSCPFVCPFMFKLRRLLPAPRGDSAIGKYTF